MNRSLAAGDSNLSSMTDDESAIIGLSIQWHAGTYTAVNPAPGLPMRDGCIDVMGNLWSASWITQATRCRPHSIHTGVSLVSMVIDPFTS